MPFQLPPVPLNIKAQREIAIVGGAIEYEGDVVVEYAGSRVLADRLTVYPSEQRGVAEGNVVVIDPSGTVNADRLELGWNPAHRFERAENVTLRIGNGILKARHADLDAKEWQLYDVEGTTCFRGTPIYYVTSDRVYVSEGKQATIHQPRVSFLGKFIAQIPTQRASLIPAVPGIGLPAPTYKKTRGIGASWSGGLLVRKNETFNFNSTVYVKRRLSGLTQYTHSFLPVEKATQVVSPRTDFGERFYYGFLNNISTQTPEQEDRYLRAKRSTLSGLGQLYGGVADRARGNRYSKIEGIYETGGPAGRFGYLGQARFQGIQPEGEGMDARLKLVGVLSAPTVVINSKLRLLSRLDSEGFLGRTGYGWAEGTSGLSYEATRFLRLSAGGYLSGDFGTPQFAMDPLHARRGLLARSDLRFGGLTLTYLVKRDIGLGAYDHEFAIRQVIGCFEAFYSRREFPRDRHLGLTIRVQPFVDALKERVSEFSGNPAPKAGKR